MNLNMVWHLMRKDWSFHRWTLLGYLLGGLVALTLVGAGGEVLFGAGGILLVTVLISMGIHLVMATVVEERTNKTLTFVMGLPVSVMEYTIAKVLANLLIFLVPWATLLFGTFAVIAHRAALPDGMVPYAGVVLTEIFAGYLLVLAVALISESQAWTIVSIVVSNLLFQAFLYWVSNRTSMTQSILQNDIHWSGTAINVLSVELLLMAVLLLTVWLIQSRKKDFL